MSEIIVSKKKQNPGLTEIRAQVWSAKLKITEPELIRMKLLSIFSKNQMRSFIVDPDSQIISISFYKVMYKNTLSIQTQELIESDTFYRPDEKVEELRKLHLDWFYEKFPPKKESIIPEAKSLDLIDSFSEATADTFHNNNMLKVETGCPIEIMRCVIKAGISLDSLQKFFSENCDFKSDMVLEENLNNLQNMEKKNFPPMDIQTCLRFYGYTLSENLIKMKEFRQQALEAMNTNKNKSDNSQKSALTANSKRIKKVEKHLPALKSVVRELKFKRRDWDLNKNGMINRITNNLHKHPEVQQSLPIFLTQQNIDLLF
jgi:hypothetical protein